MGHLIKKCPSRPQWHLADMGHLTKFLLSTPCGQREATTRQGLVFLLWFHLSVLHSWRPLFFGRVGKKESERKDRRSWMDGWMIGAEGRRLRHRIPPGDSHDGRRTDGRTDTLLCISARAVTAAGGGGGRTRTSLHRYFPARRRRHASARSGTYLR